MSSRILRVLLHVVILLTVVFAPIALDCGPRVSSQARHVNAGVRTPIDAPAR